jgi:hypothetical protein
MELKKSYFLEEGHKMAKYKKKTLSVNIDEATKIIDYLGLYIKARSGIFDLNEKGKVNVKRYQGKIEIICDCDEGIINELGEIIKIK